MRSEFWDSINSIRTAYFEFIDDICEKYKFTRAEVDIILFLYKHKDLDTATDIVRSTGYSKSNVSTAIRHLELAEYIKCVVKDTNRRVTHLTLLPKTNEVVRYIKKKEKELEESSFSSITTEEVTILNEIMSKFTENRKKESVLHDTYR